MGMFLLSAAADAEQIARDMPLPHTIRGTTGLLSPLPDLARFRRADC
jgi:hypothetical protein